MTGPDGAAERIVIEPELGTIVRLAGLRLTGLRVEVREPSLDGPLQTAATEMMRQPDQNDVTVAVRALYRQFGIDPTRRRPSSEALLRRVRRGDPLPRDNALVDVCNWCSMESHLPFALYDAGRISGGVVCRRGRAGEAYPGIRKDDVHLDGRLVLADRAGAFGNPSSDSARTMISSSTVSALLVVFVPAAVEAGRVASTLEMVAARMAEFVAPQGITRWTAAAEAAE